mmetsp:Transcript_16607/g.63126  ORF Transcript_16607/g.63126 Transcript_16607/m.63126 type:complete len:185 (+) Transcript_16607:62-616(+)
MTKEDIQRRKRRRWRADFETQVLDRVIKRGVSASTRSEKKRDLDVARVTMGARGERAWGVPKAPQIIASYPRNPLRRLRRSCEEGRLASEVLERSMNEFYYRWAFEEVPSEPCDSPQEISAPFRDLARSALEDALRNRRPSRRRRKRALRRVSDEAALCLGVLLEEIVRERVSLELQVRSKPRL